MGLKTPSRTHGLLCVVSGPSGAGKTTICRRLAETDPNVTYTVSCTTRAPREGEVDGVDYHFLIIEEFESRIEAGEFLEYARVHGRLYGTLVSSVTESLLAGKDVVMDLDVQGGELIRQCQDALIVQCRLDVFIMPPDPDEIRKRLQGRGTESQENFELRMRNALEEMEHWPNYEYLILSADREEDFASFQSIIRSERMRVSRL